MQLQFLACAAVSPMQIEVRVHQLRGELSETLLTPLTPSVGLTGLSNKHLTPHYFACAMISNAD
jgi:hypothetical protein